MLEGGIRKKEGYLVGMGVLLGLWHYEDVALDADADAN